jgi:pyruvate,water dikinase
MDESKRTKPSLSDKQLRELAELLVQIERHYKVPLDVEWCHDGVNFWVIQSRPVTLPVNPSGSSIEWTRANICEILPDLASPQVLSWICSLVNRVGREYFGNMIAPETELGPLARVFYGRMYYNLSQFRHICRIIGNAPVSVLCAMGHDGDIKPEDKVAKRPKFKELIRVLPDILRHLRMQLTVDKQIHGHLALIQDKMIHHLARDPNTLPCAEIWSVIKSALDTAPENLQMTLVLGSVMVYDLLLQVICKRVGFPYERLVYSHLAIGEKSVSTQQAYDLLSMAHLACRDEHVRNYFIHYPDSFSGFREDLRGTAFLREFDAFLRRYGHRGTYESDWALPRYHEDPASLLFAIRAHVQAPEYSTLEAIEERQIREAREVWNGFVAKLNWWKRLTVLPLMQWLFRKMKQMYLWREHYRSEMMRCIAELRRWHLCLARRFTELGWIEKSEDYFFLRLDEIEESMTDTSRSGSFREIVARRKSDLNVWQHLKMPLLMSERELPTLVRCANATFPDTQVTILRGLCVSAGCVEGEVLVIREPKDFVRMRNGAILVTSAADPSWTPLFTLASGVILEIGGIISHAATVAREYGLPTVANLKNATKLLKDGDWIRLDATNGAVEIISRVIPWQQEEEGPGHIRGGRQREAPH